MSQVVDVSTAYADEQRKGEGSGSKDQEEQISGHKLSGSGCECNRFFSPY